MANFNVNHDDLGALLLAAARKRISERLTEIVQHEMERIVTDELASCMLYLHRQVSVERLAGSIVITARIEKDNT